MTTQDDNAIGPVTLYAMLKNSPAIQETGVDVKEVIGAPESGFVVLAHLGQDKISVSTGAPPDEAWRYPEVLTVVEEALDREVRSIRAGKHGIVLPDEQGRFRDGGVIT